MPTSIDPIGSSLAETDRFDADRFQFAAMPRGGLRIWDRPRVGAMYVAGIDSSSGMNGSDFAALCMLETRSRALVCTWDGRFDPTTWGYMCASIGLYYNQAMLAFETAPSQHGLSACLAAQRRGANLYVRTHIGLTTNIQTKQLGWHMHMASKGVVWNRIRLALRDKNEIPYETLLLQLRQAKLDNDGKVEFEKNDDLAVSYGIAQCVCDIVGQTGFVTMKDTTPLTDDDRWWKYKREKEAMEASGGRRDRPRMRAENGV